MVRASRIIRSECFTRLIHNLLAVDDIAVALAHCRGLDPVGVGTGGGFGDAYRLQSQFAAGYLWQVGAPLFLRAVPDQRVHIVHLVLAGTGIAACTIDLLHDHACRRQRQPAPPILLGHQRRHPAGTGQRGDKLSGIAAFMVDAAVIFIGKFCLDRPYPCTDIIEIIWSSHYQRPVMPCLLADYLSKARIVRSNAPLRRRVHLPYAAVGADTCEYSPYCRDRGCAVLSGVPFRVEDFPQAGPEPS